jgi:hypothetical protein
MERFGRIIMADNGIHIPMVFIIGIIILSQISDGNPDHSNFMGQVP